MSGLEPILIDAAINTLGAAGYHVAKKGVEYLTGSSETKKKKQKQQKNKGNPQQAQQKPLAPYIDLAGILVEFYAFSKIAYVGGGFGRSIHSVLEPAVASKRCYVGFTQSLALSRQTALLRWRNNPT